MCFKVFSSKHFFWRQNKAVNKGRGRRSVVKAAKGFWFHGNTRNLKAFWNSWIIIVGESPCCCRCRKPTLYVSHCWPADSHRQPPRERTSSSAGVRPGDSAASAWTFRGGANISESLQMGNLKENNPKSSEFCNRLDRLRRQSCVRLLWLIVCKKQWFVCL